MTTTDHEAEDYALQRRRLRDAEERVTEAHALIRDMVPKLRSPGWNEAPKGRREILDLRRRAEELGREATNPPGSKPGSTQQAG